MNAKRRKQRQRRILIVVLGFVLLALLLFGIAFWLWSALSGKPTDGNVSDSSAVSSSQEVSSGSAASSSQGGSSGTTGSSSQADATSQTSVPAVPPAQYIQPAGAEWNLILVNDYNKAPDWCFDKTYLVKHGTGEFDERAVGALSEMIAAAKKAGITDLVDLSTYRTFQTQEKNFNKQVDKYKKQGYSQEEAERIANTIVKRPGYSEHHTGLAADMGGSGDYTITMSFESTPAFDWLIEHCAEYGFILRFPKDKEEITGVTYEPWHYRYVGKEHAKIIMDRGLCLEEYLQEIGK